MRWLKWNCYHYCWEWTSAVTSSSILTSKTRQTGLKRLTESAVLSLPSSTTPALHQRPWKLQNAAQKCPNEQKLGSLIVFKADLWKLLYSEAAADFALPKTTSNIMRRHLNAKEAVPPGCPYRLGDSQEKTHFQAWQWGCKQLRFSKHFWSPLQESSFLQGNSQSPGDLKMSLNSSLKMSPRVPPPPVFLFTSKYTLYVLL